MAVVESLTESARAAVPAALREATVQAAMRVASGQTVAAVASSKVAAWADGASRVMTIYRWKTAAGLLLLIGALGTGIGLALAGANPLRAAAARGQTHTLAGRSDDRTANLREMLQLKGTWTSQEIMQQTIDHVPQPPKTLQAHLVDRSRHNHRKRRGRVRLAYLSLHSRSGPDAENHRPHDAQYGPRAARHLQARG